MHISKHSYMGTLASRGFISLHLLRLPSDIENIYFLLLNFNSCLMFHLNFLFMYPLKASAHSFKRLLHGF